MRIVILAVALGAWFVCAPIAQAQSAEVTLGAIADMVPGTTFPNSPETAPASISLPDAFAVAVRAAPIDGGREKTLFIAFRSGQPMLKAAIGGERYTASGDCGHCDFPMPIPGHTHPYENPFSVQDLKLVMQNREPGLMVTRTGQIWLAVPTQQTLQVSAPASRDVDAWLTMRYALFGNRLECPASAPMDGWGSQTPMARRVEITARVAASHLGIALYVSDPDEPLRRLSDVSSDIDVFSGRRGLTPEDLGAFEMSLLRLMHGVAQSSRSGTVGWPEPSQPYPGLDAALALPVGGTGERRETVSGLLNLGRILSAAEDHWIPALPTTIYTSPFADTTRRDLPFVSVQNSPDCARILVMEGVQTFAPDSVTYSRGWARDRHSDAAITEGWSVMAPEDFPRGQVVPW